MTSWHSGGIDVLITCDSLLRYDVAAWHSGWTDVLIKMAGSMDFHPRRWLPFKSNVALINCSICGNCFVLLHEKKFVPRLFIICI